jgi:hypothetical protein
MFLAFIKFSRLSSLLIESPVLGTGSRRLLACGDVFAAALLLATAGVVAVFGVKAESDRGCDAMRCDAMRSLAPGRSRRLAQGLLEAHQGAYVTLAGSGGLDAEHRRDFAIAQLLEVP